MLLDAYLKNFIFAMIPLTELRAAIPVGIAQGLDPIWVYFTAVLGNLLPVPLIMLLSRRIFAWMRGKSRWLDGMLNRLNRKVEKKAAKVTKYERLGLLLFVAIPLPGTGAWTGALIATFLDLRIKNAVLSILAGLLIAGLIVTLLTMGIIAL